MIRQFLLLLNLILGLSGNSIKQERLATQSIPATQPTQISFTRSYRIKDKITRNIRFDFTAERMSSFTGIIEIKGSLFNATADTVYFLSSTCEGEQYSLRYDTTKFTLMPFLDCNASFPIIIKIAPDHQHNFQAHFRCTNKETKIKLGLDFYSVDKSFDLTNKNLEDLHIFNRSADKQTIMWGGEKTIN